MAWLSGYSYRKAITITGQASSGTGYQVLLNVGESAGAVGENFDLDSKSTDFPAAKDDGGDLRFTDNDGTTLLDFWVESVTGTTPNRLAGIWVEVADNLNSNVDIYCYYGYTGQSNGSNGDNTFTFHDDFPGVSIDTNKWTGDTAKASVAGSEMSFNPGDPSWYTITGATASGAATTVFRSLLNITNADASQVGLKNATNSHNALILWESGANIRSSDGTTQSGVASNWTSGSAKTDELKVIGGTSTAGWENGVERTGSPKTNNPPNSTDLRCMFSASTTGVKIVSDWVLIRKYNGGTEPAFSSAGVEETETGLTTRGFLTTNSKFW